jgi:hypothetical protein
MMPIQDRGESIPSLKLTRYGLCCDDARFLNHSAAPNLETDYSSESHGIDRAARDIAQGEELTVNYGKLEEDALGQ